MIADIFYPIFILTTTILVCFIRKKNCLGGFAPTSSPRYCPGSPGGRGAYSSPPPDPSCNCFWLCQKPMQPYFFCIIPCSGLGSYCSTCVRLAVQALLWSLEFVIPQNLKHNTISISNLAQSWSISTQPSCSCCN